MQFMQARPTWITLTVMSLAVATLAGCSSSSKLSSASAPTTDVSASTAASPSSTEAASTTAPTTASTTTAPAKVTTTTAPSPTSASTVPASTASPPTTAPAAPPAVASTLPPASRQDCPVGGDDVIRLGDGVGFGCESVRHVQELLTSNGYPVPADGEFGPGTETAVRAFQADNYLDVDGLVGPATWDILNGFAGDY
jgi:hypothetical protein